jgi:Lon protease-like protein
MPDLQELPLFPLKTVLFPGMPLPLHIFEERYKLMINESIKSATPFGVVLIREGQEVGAPAVPHLIGTSAFVTQVERLPEGRMNIDTIGYKRFRIRELNHDKPYLTGLVEDFPLEVDESAEISRDLSRLRTRLSAYLDVLAGVFDMDVGLQQLPDDPVALAFLAAIVLNVPADEKQEILSLPDLGTLLSAEVRIVGREIGLLKFMLEQEQRSRNRVTPFSDN